jgi:hypothetical protein
MDKPQFYHLPRLIVKCGRKEKAEMSEDFEIKDVLRLGESAKWLFDKNYLLLQAQIESGFGGFCCLAEI